MVEPSRPIGQRATLKRAETGRQTPPWRGVKSLERFLPGRCFLGRLDPSTSIIHSKSVSPSPVLRLPAPRLRLSFHSVFN